MLTTSNRTQETVIGVLKQFEDAELSYAVLRNYEKYPDFSHDVDLVLPHAQVHQATRIIAEAACELGWDSVTECAHWNRKKGTCHSIEVFRFYSLENFEYLQMDLFHGMALWGIPFLDEQELLSSRLRDPRGFWRVSEANENLVRLMQLSRIPIHTEKYQRYLVSFLNYVKNYRDEFLVHADSKLGKAVVPLLDALMNGDNQQARRFFRQVRMGFLQAALRKWGLLFVLRAILQRCLSQWDAYMRNPCGFTLKFDGPEAQEALLCEALEFLREKNWLMCWGKSHSGSISKWSDRKILERGGILIQRSRSGADFVCHKSESVESLARKLATLLMERHPSAREVSL